MKKYLLLIVSFFILSNSFSFSVIKAPITQANQIFVAVDKNGEKISLQTISKISIKDYQNTTGKKLNLFERMNFKAAQKKARRSINSDGTVSVATAKKYGEGGFFGDFNIGGFALGLFLFLPGVLIAYLIGGDDEDIRRNRIRWAWKGAFTLVLIGLAIYRSLVI